MSSPWPPRVIAVTSRTETPSSQEMKVAKRAESSTPAWPMTRGVGEDDDEGFGGELLDPLGDLAHDLRIALDQVVAAHAGLSGEARRDDDDVGAGDIRVVVGPLEGDIETVDLGSLGDVEALSLGHPLDDVEQHDVAEFALGTKLGEHATDLTATDNRNLFPCHGCLLEDGEYRSN